MKKKYCNIRDFECYRNKICYVRYAYLSGWGIFFFKI